MTGDSDIALGEVMIFRLTIIIALLFSCCGTAFADQEIWKTSFPPSNIELDIAITQAFAKKFNAVLLGKKVPFARRLNQLKIGEIDLLAGLLKDEEREQYAYFISPPYKRKTNKYFFMRKGEEQRLQKYEDLYQLSVGVQIGSKYFPRFDKDAKIKKYAISRDESRFKMLVLKRFDALIHTDIYGMDVMHRLALQDKLEIAPYKYTRYNPVYIAISNRSGLIERKDELEKVFREMVDSGEVDKIFKNYFESKGLPVPVYK